MIIYFDYSNEFSRINLNFSLLSKLNLSWVLFVHENFSLFALKLNSATPKQYFTSCVDFYHDTTHYGWWENFLYMKIHQLMALNCSSSKNNDKYSFISYFMRHGTYDIYWDQVDKKKNLSKLFYTKLFFHFFVLKNFLHAI